MFSAVTRRWISNFSALHSTATGSSPARFQASSVRSRSFNGVSLVKATNTSSTKQSLRAEELLEIRHAHLPAHDILFDPRALGVSASRAAPAKRRIGFFGLIRRLDGLDRFIGHAVAPGQLHGIHVHGMAFLAQLDDFGGQLLGALAARREVRMRAHEGGGKSLLLEVRDR